MFRKFKPEDKDSFVKMSKEFYSSDAVSHSIPDENIVDTFELIVQGSPYVEGYIIECEGRLAGYAQLSLSYSTEAGGITLWLEELYIRESFRGKGIGAKFLQFMEDEKAGKIARIRLEVTTSNIGAIKLYKKFGYKEMDYMGMYKEIKE